MIHKHERCLTSYVVGEMQIKIIRYHYTHIIMTNIQNATPNASEDVEH